MAPFGCIGPLSRIPLAELLFTFGPTKNRRLSLPEHNVWRVQYEELVNITTTYFLQWVSVACSGPAEL